MKVRRIVSLTMLFSFIVMSYTGILLFICPKGRVAYWTGWRLLGLSKNQYGDLHTTFMVIFLVAGTWHVVLNWRPITHYLKNRGRKMKVFTAEFNVALALTAVVLAGTLAGWAPFSSLLSLGEAVKDYWEQRDGSPPWGHAEENSLARFSRGLVDWERLEHGLTVGLSVADAIAALRASGVQVTDGKQRLDGIADRNGTTPQALMDIIRRAERPMGPAAGDEAPAARRAAGSLPRPASGLGRMTLRAYSERYDIDLDEMLEILAAGVSGPVDVDARLRVVASQLGVDPEGVLDRLSEALEAKRAAPPGS